MHLEDFAKITQRIIQKNGFDGFLPTLCLPEHKHVTVLEGVPDERQSEIRSISLAWAEDKAAGEEEFFLAFREDSASFRVIRRFRGELDERVFPVA